LDTADAMLGVVDSVASLNSDELVPVFNGEGERYSIANWPKLLVLCGLRAFSGYKKPRRGRGFYVDSGFESAVGHNIRRLGTFVTLLNVKSYRLALGKGFEPTALDRGEVYEHVLAAVRRGNKSEAFGFVEPFYCTCRHFDKPLDITIRND
jgi:hypothetical protein